MDCALLLFFLFSHPGKALSFGPSNQRARILSSPYQILEIPQTMAERFLFSHWNSSLGKVS